MIPLVVECQCGAWDVGAVIRNGLKMHLERIHTDNRMYLLVDGAEPSFCSRSLEIAMMDLSIESVRRSFRMIIAQVPELNPSIEVTRARRHFVAAGQSLNLSTTCYYVALAKSGQSSARRASNTNVVVSARVWRTSSP